MSEDAPPLKRVPELLAHTERSDSAANREEKAILENNYEDDRRRQDHHRTQGIKNATYQVLRVAVWFGVVLIITMTAVWAYHLLTPESWQWLDKDQVERLQGLLFSGALSAAITLIGKRVL